MSDFLTGQSLPRMEEEANTEIAQMFAEMERLNALMQTDSIEIARFRQKADAYKKDAERWKTESVKQKIELPPLRQERQALARETRLILDRLKANGPC